MKTVMRPLLIAVLVLSVMSTSRAFAGPGFPPRLRPHTPSDDPFYSDRAPSEFPVFRGESRDQVSDERLYWQDPLRPSGAPPSGGNGGGQSVPLDGGVSLLLAAGIGLGLKKMRKGQDIEKTV